MNYLDFFLKIIDNHKFKYTRNAAHLKKKKKDKLKESMTAEILKIK